MKKFDLSAGLNREDKDVHTFSDLRSSGVSRSMTRTLRQRRGQSVLPEHLLAHLPKSKRFVGL